MATNPDSGAADILIRVWGMARGKAFFQNVYARHLTAGGALLINLENLLETEDVVGVQFAEKKARFRVVNVSEGGLPERYHAEVQMLEGQTCPWEQQLEAAASAPAPGAGSRSNKRQFPRLRVRFPIELRTERAGGIAMQTNSADISGRGCYIETLVPLPLGTPLQVVFWLDGERSSINGLVRSSDPGVGMGIEFTGLDLPGKLQLQKYLEKLTAEAAGAGSLK